MLIGLPNLYDKFLIARFIAIAIILAIIFSVFLIRKNRWNAPNSPVFICYLSFLLFCGISAIWATNTAEAVFTFACQLLMPLTIIVIYNVLGTNQHLARKVLWTTACVVLTVYLTFTIIQLFHIDNFSYEQLYRVSGINGHKNLLAAMLFLLSAFLLTSFTLFESRMPKVISVVLFVVSTSVIILLKSRAVFLSAIIAVCFLGLNVIIRKKKQGFSKRAQTITTVTTIIGVYAFLTVGLRWFAARSVPRSAEKSEIETKITSTSSLVERCLMWDKTYQITDKHPWHGCGIGNWQVNFPDAGLKGLYRADIWNVNFTKPHNEYLGVLSETGYFGLLVYIVFLATLILKAFFTLNETKNRKDFFYGTVVLSVFVGCCVNALFDFPNSRVEHIVWMGILTACLFRIITQDQERNLPKVWNIGFLAMALMLIALGLFRYHGERNTFDMQKALKANDWKAAERYCQRAQSLFYTIDPVGLPLHWYQGKAQKMMGKPEAINSFRKAYRHAPFCKENLNDLGLVEYHTAHNLEKAEFYLQEAIRISPNYLYPYLNLAYIYLREDEVEKAKNVADQIYFDENKRDVMKADAVFFEPFNPDVVIQRIDRDYEAYKQLQRDILER